MWGWLDRRCPDLRVAALLMSVLLGCSASRRASDPDPDAGADPPPAILDGGAAGDDDDDDLIDAGDRDAGVGGDAGFDAGGPVLPPPRLGEPYRGPSCTVWARQPQGDLSSLLGARDAGLFVASPVERWTGEAWVPSPALGPGTLFRTPSGGVALVTADTLALWDPAAASWRPFAIPTFARPAGAAVAWGDEILVARRPGRELAAFRERGDGDDPWRIVGFPTRAGAVTALATVDVAGESRPVAMTETGLWYRNLGDDWIRLPRYPVGSIARHRGAPLYFGGDAGLEEVRVSGAPELVAPDCAAAQLAAGVDELWAVCPDGTVGSPGAETVLVLRRRDDGTFDEVPGLPPERFGEGTRLGVDDATGALLGGGAARAIPRGASRWTGPSRTYRSPRRRCSRTPSPGPRRRRWSPDDPPMPRTPPGGSS